MTLPQALQTIPNAHIIRNGGQGQPASVSIRGSSADEILVLWDGARLNDPSLVGGGVDLGLISPYGAERIDIISGPAGAQWGSGATGGVILIQPTITDHRISAEGSTNHNQISLSLAPQWGQTQSVIHIMNAQDASTSAATDGLEIDSHPIPSLYSPGFTPFRSAQLAYLGFEQQ